MKLKKTPTQFRSLITLLLNQSNVDKNFALKHTGCTTLAQRVADLEGLGITFKRNWKDFTTRQGTPGRMIAYTIVKNKKLEKVLKMINF